MDKGLGKGWIMGLKQAYSAILIFDKKFKLKLIKRYIQGHFVLIKRNNHRQGIITLNI